MTQVNDTIENLKQDVAELKKLVESAKRPKVIDVLTIEIRKQETKLADLIEKEKASKKETTTVTPTNNAIQAKAYDYTIRNYSWDQSEKFVKLYLTGLDGAKEVDSSNIELTLTSSSFYFKISSLKGKNWIFEIKELSSEIDAEKSHYKAKSDMVVLFLKKAQEGTKWKFLRNSEKIAAEKPAFAAPEPGENEDPSQGLMKMMKKMYEEGDDEMKRTIAKAWTEGNSKRTPGDLGDLGGMAGMDL